MSAETMEWLNTQVLVNGALGRPWWADEAMQAESGTIYDGPVPVADIERRLFNFTLESAPVYVAIPADLDTATGMDADGNPVRFVAVEGRQGIYRSDTETVGGIFKGGYVRHQYTGEMVDTVRAMTGDNSLCVQSAGLLQGGFQAWIQVTLNQGTIITPEGVEFRPYLLGFTSADGSLATGFTEVVGLTVCDNTMAANRAQGRGEIKAKHTTNSLAKIRDAAVAHQTLDALSAEFAAMIAADCAVEVTPQQWENVIAELVPVPETAGRGQTMANNKRDRLADLTGDPRVNPWKGTRFGMVQLFNTWGQHDAIVRGTHRAARNMSNTLSGDIAKGDDLVRSTVDKVLQLV